MMNLSSLYKAQITLALSTLLIICGMSGVYEKVTIGSGLALLLVSSLLVYKAMRELNRTAKVVMQLKQGEFEARVMNITEGGNIGNLQKSINNRGCQIDCVSSN